MTQDNTGKKFPYDATTLALAIKHTVEKYRLDEAKNAMDKEPVPAAADEEGAHPGRCSQQV